MREDAVRLCKILGIVDYEKLNTYQIIDKIKQERPDLMRSNIGNFFRTVLSELDFITLRNNVGLRNLSIVVLTIIINIIFKDKIRIDSKTLEILDYKENKVRKTWNFLVNARVVMSCILCLTKGKTIPIFSKYIGTGADQWKSERELARKLLKDIRLRNL